ncbi:hypothetical protein PSTT_00397 [Puccinia striiformis]|uniref:Uncharacterized protein n=1 Tax=Puccinia striiformis TaxID=27350 RepID=A0A2S4W6Z9_9BASI|nr:hypothetical protein PSTT_00397 [Puccinia striiformis]
MGVISVGRLDTYGKILNSRVQYSIGLWPVISDNAKNSLMGWGCKRRVVERGGGEEKRKGGWMEMQTDPMENGERPGRRGYENRSIREF